MKATHGAVRPSLSSFAPLVSLAPGLGGRMRKGSEQSATVLWLHDYCLDSSCWCELWERLPQWRHIGIDLPGHGASLPAPTDEDLPALAERLARVAKTWDARHVVALGLGTLVALQLVVNEPRTISSLTLASPWIGGDALSHPAVDLQQVLAFENAIDGPGSWMTDRLLDAKGAPFANVAPGRLRSYLEHAIKAHGFWELRDGWLVRMAQHLHSLEDLARIDTPTLVVTGDRCLDCDARGAVTLLRTLASSHQVVLPNVGTLAMLEAPQAACDAIEGHLRAASLMSAHD